MKNENKRLMKDSLQNGRGLQPLKVTGITDQLKNHTVEME